MISAFDLSRFPRTTLAHLPTPLELTTIGAGLGIRVFVKRDDCTGLGLGGNKTRKLEFTLGDALSHDATLLITSGARHSNHVRQTAAAAARIGLRCQVVLHDPVERQTQFYAHSGNLLLDTLFGAEIHFVASDEDATCRRIEALTHDANAAGENPYVVAAGASDGIGALGYANCAHELLVQCARQNLTPSAVVLATGSGGTHAGLLGGLRSLGSGIPVIGISVSESANIKRAKVWNILHEMIAKLGSDTVVPDSDIVVYDDYAGAGYSIPTPESHDAILRLARNEGLLLDPVYTAKGIAGLLDLARRGTLSGDIVFLHTGGSPALFAYNDDFQRPDLYEKAPVSC
ncbi:MAG: D-cysteine desulfhydrase family protein [Gammaproteobacteria bacterium]